MTSGRRGCTAERPRTVSAILTLEFDRTQYNALAKLARSFPAADQQTGKLLPRREQVGILAFRIVLLNLAQAEVSRSLLLAMIRYCNAEGLDQQDYLRSMIKLKFNKPRGRRRRRFP
jgi:hypothetical protein